MPAQLDRIAVYSSRFTLRMIETVVIRSAALARHSSLDARAIATEAMAVAAEICIYTNSQVVIEEL